MLWQRLWTLVFFTLTFWAQGAWTKDSHRALQAAVGPGGVPASLMRKEDGNADGNGREGDDEVDRADCTGLLRSNTCSEHGTAAVCESHKTRDGGDVFRCSWKPSVPAGDEAAVPGDCYIDASAKPCGLTDGVGPNR
eukprot:TRINITY_DN38270_c0_g1_i1.p1 TRINITY_DN38270_c0_g1~~TRINITY_DN38270_c0_g1_i1.p1  ORF type:complete len:137 (-),score=21.88 TRINITY_DN38270_c0_g1_i1:2-412(-)